MSKNNPFATPAPFNSFRKQANERRQYPDDIDEAANVHDEPSSAQMHSMIDNDYEEQEMTEEKNLVQDRPNPFVVEAHDDTPQNRHRTKSASFLPFRPSSGRDGNPFLISAGAGKIASNKPTSAPILSNARRRSAGRRVETQDRVASARRSRKRQASSNSNREALHSGLTSNAFSHPEEVHDVQPGVHVDLQDEEFEEIERSLSIRFDNKIGKTKLTPISRYS